jgi:hypothetical protein
LDLWSTLRVLLKRWYLTIPLIALSAIVTVAVVGTKPADYKANASLLLLTPSGGGANPYAQFGGSLSAAAEVLATSMNSSTSKLDLQHQGVKSDWNLALEGGDAPLLTVETTAPTSDEATGSAKIIVETAKQRLASLQSEAGAPTNQLITLSIVDAPDGADAEYGKTVKAGAALFLVLLVASCAIVFAFEALSRRRAARKEATVAAKDNGAAGNGAAGNGAAGNGAAGNGADVERVPAWHASPAPGPGPAPAGPRGQPVPTNPRPLES